MPATTEAGQVAAALRQARRVVVAMHQAPDGDTTGSALALAAALRRLGVEVEVVGPDPIIAPLRFLPRAEEAQTWAARPSTPRADVVVTVDCGEASRAGGLDVLRSAGALLINLDHHASNSRFGDLNWVEPRAVAVGELVLRLVDEWELLLAEDVALPLYVSLATDTEGFRVGVREGRVFRMAARLADTGLDVEDVHRRLFEEEPLAVMRLRAWALQHLQQAPSGHLAWLALPRRVLTRFGVEPYQTDGLISLVRALRGVHLAVFLREEPEGLVKVSLRSRPPVEARRIAERLGGGGHTHAAAALVSGRLPGVQAETLALASELYGEDERWTDSSTF